MNKIEEVGRAIYEERYVTEIAFGAMPDWANICPHELDNVMAEARAAIEAMREPTDAMVDAGYNAVCDRPSCIFTDMIDAALNEQHP